MTSKHQQQIFDNYKVMFGAWNSICKIEKNFSTAKQEKDNSKNCLFLCLKEVEKMQKDIDNLYLEISYDR